MILLNNVIYIFDLQYIDETINAAEPKQHIHITKSGETGSAFIPRFSCRPLVSMVSLKKRSLHPHHIVLTKDNKFGILAPHEVNHHNPEICAVPEQ